MKKLLLLSALICCLLAPAAAALDNVTRPVGPVRSWEGSDLHRCDPHWLHLKFVEGAAVSLDRLSFSGPGQTGLDFVNQELSRHGAVEIRRTFPGDAERFRRLKALGEARSGVTGPDLSLWYNVRVAGGPETVASLINRLNACPAVEIAHPVAIPEPAAIQGASRPLPPTRGTRSPDYSGLQDYLYSTPVGLDAPSAWALPGGGGSGMKFIDVELCWTEDHEDFDTANLFHIGGAAQDPSYEEHGTAVLGEVIGQHDGSGVDGFAPDVDYGVVAVTVAEWPDVPHYFQEAVDNLDAGDVWLIELQMYPSGMSATPMEYLQVNYDVIWTGVFGRGVVCVEAGANGTQDLDAPVWGGLFDRTVRDSGAIMVGAGTPTGRVAEWFTNWGSRMDVHAWGSEIVTTGYGDLYNGGSLQTMYTADFGGTSGASPMVTGSSLCLQGIARESLNRVLNPLELRSILHDTGIAHLDPTKEIGPRPDLGAASAHVLSLAVDTVDAAYSCVPATGTVPFQTTMTVTLTNLYGGLTRTIAGRINVTIANGNSYSNWKSGFTNVAAGSSYDTFWNQTIPALGSVVGSNVFTLEAEDVTASPYNQPPHPPAGDTATAACTVLASSP